MAWCCSCAVMRATLLGPDPRLVREAVRGARIHDDALMLEKVRDLASAAAKASADAERALQTWCRLCREVKHMTHLGSRHDIGCAGRWRRCSMSLGMPCSTCSQLSQRAWWQASEGLSGMLSSCHHSSWRTGYTTGRCSTLLQSTSRLKNPCPRKSTKSCWLLGHTGASEFSILFVVWVLHLAGQWHCIHANGAGLATTCALKSFWCSQRRSMPVAPS